MDAAAGSGRSLGWAARWWGRLFGPLLLTVVGVVALPAAVGAAQAGGAPIAQIPPGDQPSVAVLGTGEARAPAMSGTIQLIVRAVDPFAAGAAPVGPTGQPPALTEEQVQPIVDAILAAGVAPEDAEIVISQSAGSPFGTGAAQVLVELDRGELRLAEDLVAAGTEAASAAGLYVESVGAGFEVGDCDALIREARQAAADDARERAEGLADVLGLRLGEIVLASETPFYGDGAGGGCGAPVPGPAGGKGTYYPPFDPTAEPEVAVFAQINLSFAIA